MIEFQFFRVKVYPSNQLNIFDSDRSRPEILRETLLSLPSVELRRGKIWHIGNATSLDNAGLYFRIGRVSTSTIEVYHDGNFADQQFETAPYTHVLLDISLEICVIAKKTRLAPKPVGIANQFIRLLNKSEKAQQLGAMFEIGQLETKEKNGFCIMAVCSLMIETLESFYQGWPNTNGKSKSAFCFFFDRNDKFSVFRGHAQKYYMHVRCGILHQGETTGGWLIWRKGPLFDPDKKTINATRFLNALKDSLVHYCDDLKKRDWDDVLWKKLRKKMDSILKNCYTAARDPM